MQQLALLHGLLGFGEADYGQHLLIGQQMKSTFFDSQLGRLKDALGVEEDQAVGDALGMKKAAFSARKKRGSFPEKELRALAQREPERGIDVEFVLTGKPTQTNQQRGGYVASLQLEPDERELVLSYRKCSDSAQTALLQMAVELSK